MVVLERGNEVNNEASMLEQVVLGEIAGKNAAIHAYDKIIWTVRSGYLTLVFVGWSILLKGVAENTIPGSTKHELLYAMLSVSVGLGIGGFYVDWNYLRRKFRVILALNEIMDELHSSKGDASVIAGDLLKVSGDDANRNYFSSGYKEAFRACLMVYFVPLPTLALAAYFMLKLGSL